MSVYNITLKILSPIHIGDGNELRQDFDFVVYKGQTLRLNEDAILQAKEEKLKPSRDGRYPPPGKLLEEADYRNGALFRYVLRGFPRSKRVDARVKTFIKDVYDRPYIPGSSLKGALRTALAWTGWKEVKPRLDRSAIGRHKSWAGQPLEKKLFGRDPNHDLLRALQVSDLIGPQKPGEGLVLVNAQVLTKRSHGSPIELEALAGDLTFKGTITIDESLFSELAERELHFQNRRRWLEELMIRTQNHSRARIARLMEWFDEAQESERVASFYRELNKAGIKPNQALVQLGWGSGWDGKTFWTHLQQDPHFFEGLIRDFRMHRAGRRCPPPATRRPFSTVEKGCHGSQRRCGTRGCPVWLDIDRDETAMKLLTFLGLGRYEETQYEWQGRVCQARYAPAASCQFLQPSSLVVFLTEEAQSQAFPDFQAALPPDLKIQPVPVPLGKDEKELWQVFDSISAAVQPGDEVAFDVTYGLRSFPLLGLLAAAFLKSGMGISLQAVLYGALDVGRINLDGRTPMFDLSPMLELLDWASAAERFKRTGDSRQLASLVEAQKRQLVDAAAGDKVLLSEAGGLYHLGKALSGISQSLRLIRPHQAMQQVNALPEKVEKARAALKRAASARPFLLVLEDVVHSYQPLALDSPLEPQNLPNTLEIERKLIYWYAEREQWVAAVSLAREWLVNWTMYQLGFEEILDEGVRGRVEHALGLEASDYRTVKDNKDTFKPIFLKPLPRVEEVLALWLTLTDARNDIDHAGMRRESGSPKSLIKRIEKCIQDIKDLPMQTAVQANESK
jgi:CRISPR-associated protein Csm5